MFHIPISGLKYLCAKYTYCFILIGEKRLGGHHSEDTRNPTPHKEGDLSTTPHPRIWRKERWRKLMNVPTTGDVLVVEEQAEHFTSDSAQRLIQDIMVWNHEIDIIRNKLNVMEQQMKKMIDVLGRI
ncbi:hypothetical protein AB205_0144660 [Aquarana catesbeiana]|uniref:Uncharacterized protein n=1 Tax=Aquarana catesbeiana TaxID=8400 RepID=A0A2G9RB40_AQUCT|nr:hypothetical protein AB205_0144660 [Aquarana catesbeiana]